MDLSFLTDVGAKAKKKEEEEERKGPPLVRLVFVTLLFSFFSHNRHKFGASLVHYRYFVQYVSTGGWIRALSIIKPAFLHAISCQFGGGIERTKKEKSGERKRKGGEYSTIGKKKGGEERKAR